MGQFIFFIIIIIVAVLSAKSDKTKPQSKAPSGTPLERLKYAKMTRNQVVQQIKTGITPEHSSYSQMSRSQIAQEIQNKLSINPSPNTRTSRSMAGTSTTQVKPNSEKVQKPVESKIAYTAPKQKVQEIQKPTYVATKPKAQPQSNVKGMQAANSNPIQTIMNDLRFTDAQKAIIFSEILGNPVSM